MTVETSTVIPHLARLIRSQANRFSGETTFLGESHSESALSSLEVPILEL